MIQLVIFLYILSLSFTQTVSLSTYVKKRTITDNKIFKLYLEFSWVGTADDYRIELNGLPDIFGLEVLGSGSENTVSEANGQLIVKRTYFYNLKPLRRGKVSINQITARVVSKKTGASVRLNSEAIDLVVIKGKEPFTLSTKLILFIVGGILTLILLVIFILQRAKKQKLKIESFVTDDNYIEYKLKKDLILLKNEPEHTDETSAKFFKFIESYLSAEHISRETMLLDESKKISFDIKEYMERLNEIRFSGLVPDVYELENQIMKFKEILDSNLNTLKERSNKE